jgi:hypothetical protein
MAQVSSGKDYTSRTNARSGSGTGTGADKGFSVSARRGPTSPAGSGSTMNTSSRTQDLQQAFSGMTPQNIAPQVLQGASFTQNSNPVPEAVGAGLQSMVQGLQSRAGQPAQPGMEGPGQSLSYLAQFFDQLRSQFPLAGSGGLINEGLMPWRQDLGGTA